LHRPPVNSNYLSQTVLSYLTTYTSGDLNGMCIPQGHHLSSEFKTLKTRNRKMAAAEVYK